MYRWVLIIWGLLFFPFVHAEAQNISNEGTDFWAVFPTHDPSRSEDGIVHLADVRIYITSKTGSHVTVTCGSFSQSVNVPANTAVWVDVPRPVSHINIGDSNRTLVDKGIHIKVTPGHDKVAIFEHIYAGARSAASLILPRESLGREYYSMNFTQDINNGETNKNFLVLVATDPNTTLLVHKKDGTSFTVNFENAGDVYEYIPANQEDLTGTYVEVDPTSPDNCNKRFAAYSGSTALRIGCGTSRDPLFQQLYPPGSWGKSYGVVPFIGRRHIVRILAQEDNTVVQFNGATIPLNKGTYYTSTELTNGALITSNNKISVAQYSLTQACSSAVGGEIYGDPEMVLLNPIEFNVKSTTLFSSDKENITERYINVLIKTSATSTFKIDGVAVDAIWTPIPSNPEYSYTQISIYNTSSYLTANEGFNAIAYGFGDHESYAYSAGTNLAATTYFLVTNKITERDAQNACVGQMSDFKLILPYQLSKITWKLDNGSEEAGSLIHTTIKAADGTLSYEYQFGKALMFTDLRSHMVTIKVELPNDGTGCLSGEAEFIYTFDVYPLPTAAFQLPADNCADTELQFTDASDSNIPGKTLNKWLWDFGDGITSTEQNPKHIFARSGAFTVSLSVGLDEGCMSDAIPQTITIAPKITTRFSVDEKGCVNNEITFRDNSTVDPGTSIVKWIWDFGDGTPVSPDQRLPVVQHTYKSPGSFEVILVTETENGCRSLPYKETIVIKALPVPNFTIPKICTLDDVMAEFQNQSKNADGTTTGLKSYWDFGDPESPTNRSTDVDGKHKYNVAKLYVVKLTVEDIDGCTAYIERKFILNGPDVEASFEVLDKENLCSSQKVKIINKSFVQPIGDVVRLEIYFDAENNPVADIVDENPEPGKIYEFLYPAMTSAEPKPYTIKMVAYSGGSCKGVSTQEISLNPSPSLSFDNIPVLCVNGDKIQLTQARETLGITGSFSYSGTGTAPDGMFDPRAAGVGTHNITYTFIADNGGCETSLNQSVVVKPVPVVTLPLDLYILEGGEKQVDATESSSGNTYQWSPVEGLSNAHVLNPVFNAISDRAYTMTLTTGAGCVVTERVFVHVIKKLEPANAFSPNGDGVNDAWVIKYVETFPKVSVTIFNRYGEKVFFSQGYSIPFEGNYKGKPLPVGTYYYIINPNNEKKAITGSLTLIR